MRLTEIGSNTILWVGKLLKATLRANVPNRYQSSLPVQCKARQ